MKAASASRDSAPPTLNRLTPTASISAAVNEGSAALITTFKGLPMACTTVRMVAQIAQAGRVKHVSPGLLEGLQAFDGIVEVDPTPDQILCPCHERERHWQRARHLSARRHALDSVVEFVDAFAAPILDRAPNNAHFGGVTQDRGSFLGIIGVTVFQVGVDRQVGGLRDDAAILQELGAAHGALAIDAAQRVGHAEAGGGQCLEPERR